MTSSKNQLVSLAPSLVVGFAIGYISACLGPDIIAQAHDTYLTWFSTEITSAEKLAMSSSAHICPDPIDKDHATTIKQLHGLILNYSRRAHFYKVGIWPLLQKMKMNVVIACQSIRYKKEIKLWQSFTIRTAIIGYNDKDRSIWVQSWLEEIPSAQIRKSANVNLELTEKAADAGMPVVLAVHILKYVVLSTASKSKKNEQPAAAAAGTATTGAVATSDSLSTATDAANNTPTATISRSNSDASEADIWNRPRRASSACEAKESGRRQAALAALNSSTTSVTELRQIQRYLRATASALEEDDTSAPVLPLSYTPVSEALSTVSTDPAATTAAAVAPAVPAPPQALTPSQILLSVGLRSMVPGRDCSVKGNVPAVDAVGGMNVLY